MVFRKNRVYPVIEVVVFISIVLVGIQNIEVVDFLFSLGRSF